MCFFAQMNERQNFQMRRPLSLSERAWTLSFLRSRVAASPHFSRSLLEWRGIQQLSLNRVNKLKDNKLNLNVNGTDIKSYDSITLLGVDIDNALNFSGCLSNICKKHSQWVGVISRLRNLMITLGQTAFIAMHVLRRLSQMASASFSRM